MFEAFIKNWVQAAAELGLTLTPRAPQLGDPISLSGVLDGVAVESHQAPYKMYTSALIQPPAALGVSIVQVGLLEKVGHIFGAGHAGLGDSVFDREFSVKARDAASLPRVVSPELRAALLAAVAGGMHPSVDDASVKLWHQAENGMMESVAEITRSLREAARLSKIAAASLRG
jgi:hypothetical protein